VSGAVVVTLVLFALCCGVMFGVMLALFVGYSYARTRQETSKEDEEAALNDLTARIAQKYIEQAQQKETTP
jgi:MFS superfamily sulfate permease-like transporter